MKILSPDGQFEIRLTTDAIDIDAAQRLRFNVFYNEMSARPSSAMKQASRDFDEFDQICDHMLVADLYRSRGDQVVGTYRMLRHSVAMKHNGYYSAREYGLESFLRNIGPHNVCEIGRSCVHPDYRNNQTIQLLWRGLAHYYSLHNITRIFGCASFPGTDPKAIALPLSYLYHHHLAPTDLLVSAVSDRYQAMDLMPRDKIDLRRALKAVPPLIRAYLRLGGVCGDGAVIDDQFGTTDVFMILAMENVPEKYHEYFKREESNKI